MPAQVFKKFRAEDATLICVIIAGCVIVLIQFLCNRSLWLDEAMLVLNITHRSFAGLAQPLDYVQVAPIGFLMFEKLSTKVFGNGEYALRLFPLLCFFISLPLVFLLAKELTRELTVALLAVSMFSLSYAIIYYASEVKQYATDVVVCLVLILCTIRFAKAGRKMVYLTLAGCLGIWFSNVAVIVLFSCGVYLCITEVLLKRKAEILIPLLLWVGSFCLYYVLFIQGHPSTGTMKHYWADRFLPLHPFSIDSYSFIFQEVSEIYSHLIGLGKLYWIAFGGSMIGLIAAWKKKDYPIVYFCTIPIGVHLLLSGFKLYPFAGRFLLYLTPVYVTLMAYSFNMIFMWVSNRIYAIPRLMIAIPGLIMLVPAINAYPRKREEIKLSIRYIEQHLKPADDMYLFYGGRLAFTYYQEIGFTQLVPHDFIGNRMKNRDDFVMPDFDTESAHVWVLFSHVSWPKKKYDEEQIMLDQLVTHGAVLLDSFKTVGSSCYYLDITTYDASS